MGPTAHPVRALLLLLAVIIAQGLTGAAHADPGRAAQLDAARAVLSETLGEQSIDVWSTRRLREGPGGLLTAEMTLDGRRRTAVVRPKSVRAPEFRARARRENGRLELVAAPAPSTYRGFVLERPEMEVALSLRGGAMRAFVVDGDEIWNVVPVSDLLPGADLDAHVAVKVDPQRLAESTCGVIAQQAQAAVGTDLPPVQALCVPSARIAIDSDYDYFLFHGTEAGAFAEIEATINAVELIYATQVGIGYEITEIIITTAAGGPYTATAPGALLGQFRDYWNANQEDVVRDVAHLFTGKNLDGGTIGIASLGVITGPGTVEFGVCDLDDAYGLSSRIFGDDDLPLFFSELVVLAAHELGHNWSALHCNADSDCGIMCSNINACDGPEGFFGTQSFNAITAYRDEAPCLDVTERVDVFFPSTFNLVSDDGDVLDFFGSSVDIDSSTGELVAIVGAPFHTLVPDDPKDPDIIGAGAAYIFRFDAENDEWVQEAKLILTDPTPGARLGTAVAIEGDVAVAGAPLGGDLQSASGIVQVYRRTDGIWELEQEILGDPRVPNASLGWSLDVFSGLLAAGAPFDNGNAFDAGAVYVYEYDGTEWVVQEGGQVFAADGAAFDEFGQDVALGDSAEGLKLIVGAAGGFVGGAAYVYVRGADEWYVEQVVLTPSDPGLIKEFGQSVDIDVDQVVVGDWVDDENGFNAGAAYIFEYAENKKRELAWSEVAKLTAPIPGVNERFGVSVAMLDEVVLVGANGDNIGGVTSGGAFGFARLAGTWEFVSVLIPSEPDPGDQFGVAVALDAAAAIVAAQFDAAPRANRGSADVYVISLDCNDNDLLDVCEIAIDGLPDCNGNGVPDECDIEDGTSEDKNADGIPDECFTDCNGNGIDDAEDILSGMSQDCNFNTIPDECDVDAMDPDGDGLVSDDCNGNIVPDECEPDCNGNGVADECDITAGTSEDCNSNGIPDECDIDPLDPDGNGQVSPDCNGNTVPDECDLAGDSEDCNGNSIPDECDIASGASDDTNMNGIPDECEDDCNGNGFPDDFDVLIGLSEDCNGNFVPDECDVNILDPDGDGVVLPDCNGNLSPDSCDIDSGISNDIDGNGIPDDCEPDCNMNGLPDAFDIVIDFSYDCNGNGVPDECDIAGGGSTDMDGNGFPDECDTDCNMNGVSDITEVALGFADDCNDNLFPDECDIAGGGSTDMDGNGVPDECDTDCNNNGISDLTEVGLGLVPDCNGNLFPDSCDIADGTSTDDDGNGIPDECDTDCNNNGLSDLTEIAAGLTVDCNGNLVPDSCDIADGTSTDDDGNGIPDECDEDCNDNGVTDSTEVADGSVPDCNVNGIPDSCDIADGTSADGDMTGIPDECESDCNNNGQSDVLDIALGIAEDCNQNGVPDSCDVAAGDSEDVNGNGVPDECDGDCNQNFVPDDLEIALGFATDCNENGIPDDCDIASGDSFDFDGDGLPDECTPVECEDADVDGDGDVDVNDLILVIVNFGPCPMPCPFDVDGNGVVNAADLVGVFANFGCTIIPAGCPADLSGDGMVSVDDLVQIVVDWGPCPPGDCPSDLNDDGVVDVNDLLLIVVDWGECPEVLPCPGDTDGSGTINVNDLIAIISTWGPCPAPCPTDTNGDGIVNVDDLVAIIASWGDCPSPLGGPDGTIFVTALIQILTHVGPCGDLCAFDANGDGILDINDVITLAEAY